MNQLEHPERVSAPAASARMTALVLSILAAASSVSAADVTLPAGAAAPVEAASIPGFTARTAQAPRNTPLRNSFLRALQQLNHTLTDADGNLIADEAVPGGNSDGSYDVDFVNFGTDEANPTTGRFGDEFLPDIYFPGLITKGNEGHDTLFATEVLTNLRLAAGSYTMGVTAGFDRTDVNDDDGWKLFCGANSRDFFATPVAEFQRTGAGFPNGAQVRKGNTNEFSFTVPVSGTYPFRLVHWQATRATMLEWYIVLDPGTEGATTYLLNDPNLGDAIAYRKSSAPASTSPFVAEVSPLPDSSGIAANAPIEALLVDGAQEVDVASIGLFLNNTKVTPQSIVRDGRQVRVRYNPNATRSNPANLVRIDYKDKAGLALSSSWNFTIKVAGGARTVVKGQWDFDAGNLAATVGTPLAYFSTEAAEKTEFGLTTDFGIPDINNVPAKVMKVPGDLKRSIGYVMTHGISPNGGGTRVNQYTLVMDVYVGTTGPGAASLLQISSPDANTDDGDLFWQGSNFGQGNQGYNGTGQFTAGAWHRVVAAYDLAANPPVVTKYVDGIKQDDWTFGQTLDADRRALKPTAILFGDGDQDERRLMYVNSIQIREGKLSDGEMVLLGGPEAAGIPTELDSVNVAGQWDFDAKNLAATIGKPLAYFTGADGSSTLAKDLTEFGTTTEFGIPDINGVEAKVIKVPGDLKREIGYVMTHGISPNGGGTRVNQYTLIFDIFVNASGPGAASLIQISSPDANTDDGDLFWQGSNFGQGNQGYNGTGQFTAGAWHRVAAAYDLAANPPVVTKYVDGIKQDDWTFGQTLDADRRALKPTAILFGDGDQDERRLMYVNSIQIRPGKLSDADLTLLGGPSASGIPLVLPSSTVAGQWDFNGNKLAATIGKPLAFFKGGDGSSTLTEDLTLFGDTATLGVADINGEPAQVMEVPGDLSRNIGYVMNHGISPNGGGTRVNQYTLVFDIFVNASGPGAASLIQISSPDGNTDDGDLFWQGSNFGQGNQGYKGTGQFTAGAWHRVAAAYNLAATPPVVTKYVDGIFQDDWTFGQTLDADRRALKPTAILFGDGDQDERRKMWVNSIQIRNGALSKTELAALGTPTASGIPVALPPAIKFTGGSSPTISWPAWASSYVLETTTDITNPNWQPAVGAARTFVKVNSGETARFFRLRQP